MLVIFFLIHFVQQLIKSISNIVVFLGEKYFFLRMNEYRDLFNEVKTRLDFEREDRRLIETQLASK